MGGSSFKSKAAIDKDFNIFMRQIDDKEDGGAFSAAEENQNASAEEGNGSRALIEGDNQQREANGVSSSGNESDKEDEDNYDSEPYNVKLEVNKLMDRIKADIPVPSHRIDDQM